MSKKTGLPDNLITDTFNYNRPSSRPSLSDSGGRKPTGGGADDPQKIVQIRMPASMKADLLEIFRSRGLSMAAGCRSVLADYRNMQR